MNQTLEKAKVEPTITSTYAPIEAYLKHVQRLDSRRGMPKHAPSPVDALLLSLHLSYQTYPTSVIDLASKKTQGLLTLLCAASEQVGGILEYRTETDPARSLELKARNKIVEEYYPEAADQIFVHPIEQLHSDWDSLLESLRYESSVLLLIHAADLDCEEQQTRITDCLTTIPRAQCLVFGLGVVGQCLVLPELLGTRIDGKPAQVRLYRELDAAFSASGLGCVCHPDEEDAKTTLQRIGQLYHSNYDFLELHQRMVASASSTASPSSMASASPTASNSETDFQLLSEIQALQNHLALVEASAAYRMSLFFRKVCHRLAPPKTLRYRLARKTLGVLRPGKPAAH